MITLGLRTKRDQTDGLSAISSDSIDSDEIIELVSVAMSVPDSRIEDGVDQIDD